MSMRCEKIVGDLHFLLYYFLFTFYVNECDNIFYAMTNIFIELWCGGNDSYQHSYGMM
jgi:hypothetical protein